MVLLVCLFLTCCRSAEEEGGSENLQSPIAFATSLDDYTTRGTLLTKDDGTNPMKTMGVLAHICSSTSETTFKPYYFHNLKVTRDNGSAAWTYTPAFYWPGVVSSEKPIHFVAYSPIAVPDDNGVKISGNSEEPKITYTTPATLSKQPDLVATEVISAYDESKEVALPFNHILSAHRFVIKSCIAGLTFTKIEFQGIGTKADFSFSFTTDAEKTNNEYIKRAIWTAATEPDTRSYSGSGNIYVTSGLPAETGKNIITGDQCFMLLPQAFAASSTAKIRVYCNYNGTAVEESKSTISLANKTWVPGKMYSYSMSFSGNGLKFEVSESSSFIGDWGEGGSQDHGAYNW